jgi:DNA-binding LytR/AlgR family response regulator
MLNEPFIWLPVGRLTCRVATRLIVRVRGDNNYSYIFTSDGGRYLLSQTLSRIAAQLPGFIRIHKGHLVNPAFVRGITGKSHRYVRLRSGQDLPVARRRQQSVNQYFTNQLS